MQITSLRALASRDKIAKALMVVLLSRSLCSKVQWKKRGRDKRPGIGHLVNLIAIFEGS